MVRCFFGPKEQFKLPSINIGKLEGSVCVSVCAQLTVCMCVCNSCIYVSEEANNSLLYISPVDEDDDDDDDDNEHTKKRQKNKR